MKASQKILGVFLFLLVSIWIKVHFESKLAFERGKAHLQTKEWIRAIYAFDEAAHWYYPKNPYSHRALRELEILAQQALERGSISDALYAYDSIRGSIYGTRHFWIPHRDLLKRANEQIATLRAQEEVSLGNFTNLALAEQYHRGVLEKDFGPHRGWALVLVLAFFVWIGSILGLIWKGFDREGKMLFPASVPWMGLFLFSFFFWILGLVKA